MKHPYNSRQIAMTLTIGKERSESLNDYFLLIFLHSGQVNVRSKVKNSHLALSAAETRLTIATNQSFAEGIRDKEGKG